MAENAQALRRKQADDEYLGRRRVFRTHVVVFAAGTVVVVLVDLPTSIAADNTGRDRWAGTRDLVTRNDRLAEFVAGVREIGLDCGHRILDEMLGRRIGRS